MPKDVKILQGGKSTPVKPKTKDRHKNPDFKFRIDPDLDASFREAAAAEGITLQQAATSAFTAWVARRRLRPCPSCQMIAGVHLEECQARP